MFQKIINILNDLRPRQLLILAGAAAVLMFLTIILAMNLVSNKPVPIVQTVEEKPAIQTTSVIVAKVNIPPRTRIQESMLQTKEMPVDMVPEGAIRSFNEVKDVQIKVSIFAGDILTTQKVFSEKGNEGFAGEIPADCRAVAINVSEVTGVAGFAKPGDKVDLLLVEKGQYSATTNILLQNVPLLSVNQDTEGGNLIDANGVVTSSAISNPTIATFALPPQDVLKLISASKLGEIYMMLRPSNPAANYVPEMEYTIDSINKPKPETPAIPSNPVPNLPQIPAVPVAPPVPKIDIILGDEIVQSSQDVAPAKSAGANSALPAIPSGGNVSVPQPNVPLSNVSVMDQIRKNL